MRGYGLPRHKDIEFPDVRDIQEYGLKSSAGKYKTKSGDYKSYTRSSKNRNQVRLYWKRRERNIIKKELNEYASN